LGFALLSPTYGVLQHQRRPGYSLLGAGSSTGAAG
jgi:hypothetical protein